MPKIAINCRKKFRHLVESCFSNNPEIIAVLPNKGAVLLTKLLPHDAGLGTVQVFILGDAFLIIISFPGFW